jgi:hypothetical protein
MERVSLRNREYRRLVREAGAERLADAAGELKPVLDFTWSLRTPIVHKEGLGGSTYVDLRGAGAMESRVELSEEQAAALDSLRRHRHEEPAAWGLHVLASKPMVEPEVFSSRFTLSVIETADRLNRALADDLAAPECVFTPDARARRSVLRYRWLEGLPSTGFFSA